MTALLLAIMRLLREQLETRTQEQRRRAEIVRRALEEWR